MSTARLAGRWHSTRAGRKGSWRSSESPRPNSGDDTLVYAEDGILDASAGFVPMPGGETWPEKGLRRLTRCWLAHVALTAEPAYAGTEVLSVRSRQGSTTPNLDLVAGWRLEDLLASDPKLRS